MAKPVTFGGVTFGGKPAKPKSKPRGGSTAFNFGANANRKGGNRRGGAGGGS